MSDSKPTHYLQGYGDFFKKKSNEVKSHDLGA